MLPAHAWRRSAWWLLAWLLLALLAGALIGHAWQALALAAVAALLWQSVQVQRLLRRASGIHWLPAPRGAGAVARLQSRLYRRERAQRARSRRLVQAMAAFRRAAHALPDATVAVSSADLRILWFNPAARRLLGLNYPQDVGARISNLLRAPRVLEWLRAGPDAEPLMDVPAPGDPSLRLSLRLIAYDADRALLVARDVSKLTHLEQVRRDFVANVSHELRTPLTVVHGYLDMMEPEEYPPWAPLIEQMRVQSRRMAQIVEDLLTLSRLEARDGIEEARVAMAPLLATLLREAQALSGGRHAVHCEDLAAADLLGAGKEVHSAFSNLVANAVRYTPEGGRVTVRWLRDADASLVLEVEDTGPGIAPHHLPRITERFYRVSSSRSRESGGTGLGLSIVKHVLQLHQAALEIDSVPGRGSVFRCRFAPARGLARDPAPGR